MRLPQDLVELPFSFTQLRPLMSHNFVREARDRGVNLTDDQLEGLHRAKLLQPLLRVRRDGRLVVRLVHSGDMAARQAAHWHPTTRRDLLEAQAGGRLFDPGAERFIPRDRLRRNAGAIDYLASDYLYSPHQLIHLQIVKAALPYMRRKKRGQTSFVGFDVDPWWRSFALQRERMVREVVVAVSALEPIYYPAIVGTLNFAFGEEYEQYERWRRRLPLTAMLKWLRVDAEWIKKTAASLLHVADGFDPLGGWLKLVRQAEPNQWKLLKGDARNAMDVRIAAEILLHYYDDLARGRRARQLAQPKRRIRGEFDSRLKSRDRLDSTLTQFGLSPHPRLVLVVEGDTERLLLPRLMELFGIRTDEDYIAIVNMEGVRRDLNSLVSFAIAPRTEPEEDGRYLRLLRPLSRILVVTDAEGPMTSERERQERRKLWLDRIFRTLPKEHRTEAVRDALTGLVHVETWDRAGSSFEFAHFTDRELATAIARADARPRQPNLAARVTHVARIRADRANLDRVLGRTSKVALGDELWPVLERKIRRAEGRGTEHRIPIVRVLDRATDLAREWPRRGVVIPLRDT